MHPLYQFKFCPKCGSPKFIENNFKSKKCLQCGFIYYFNICGATVAFILNEKSELLVATRKNEPAKGTFDLPGGFIDLYETGEEAMAREVNEETGLIVDKVKFLFSIPNIYTYSDFDVHTIDMFFACHVKNTDNMKANDDVSKLEFIKLSDIEPDKFGLNSVRKGIQKVLSENIQLL